MTGKGKRPTNDARDQQLTVALRIRPILPHEVERRTAPVAYKLDDKMVVLMDPHAGEYMDILRAKRPHERRFVFDYVFDETSTQSEVYEQTTKALVKDVLGGYNGTVFAYGPTGAGKTYTMVGTPEEPGIMVRALNDLFQGVDESKEKHSFVITMSYLEIYNENIRDLLNPASGHLELREDAAGNHQVVGLSEVTIGTSNEVMRLLTKGNRQRTQEPTRANRTSSRSHALLEVQVNQQSLLRDSIKSGKLFMVDLAGSERASQTQNTGKRLIEGAHINKSLLALGNCINALAERRVKYVNFRDSKLTRLLKEPLCGNCKTVMIAHISPAASHFEESRNTIVYADRAKNITNKVRSNVTDIKYHVSQYQSIINELRLEIQRLHAKIEEQDRKSVETEKKLSGGEMKQLKEELITTFNDQMEKRRKVMELDTTMMSLSSEFDRLIAILNEWGGNKNSRSDLDNQTVTAGQNGRLSADEDTQQIWEEIESIQSEQARHLQMRDQVEKDYNDSRQRAHKLIESLSDKVNSAEQRELLSLLSRVYLLEAEKMEMQAEQIVRENELQQRDLMLLRYDRQRQLCEEIITKQRALIDALSENNGENMGAETTNEELMELYRVYQEEMKGITNAREPLLKRMTANPYRPNTVWGLRPLGSSESMFELSHVTGRPEPRVASNKTPQINSDTDSIFTRRQKPSSPPEPRIASHMSLQSPSGSESSAPSDPPRFPPLRNSSRDDATRQSRDRNRNSGLPERGLFGTEVPADQIKIKTDSSLPSMNSPPSEVNNSVERKNQHNDESIFRQNKGGLPVLRNPPRRGPTVRKKALNKINSSGRYEKLRPRVSGTVVYPRDQALSVAEKGTKKPWDEMVSFSLQR